MWCIGKVGRSEKISPRFSSRSLIEEGNRAQRLPAQKLEGTECRLENMKSSFSKGGTRPRNDVAQTVFLGHFCVRDPLRLLGRVE
jgi:hypothetical protein